MHQNKEVQTVRNDFYQWKMRHKIRIFIEGFAAVGFQQLQVADEVDDEE